MCIAVPGVNIADVRLSAPETQRLLQDPIIGHFEDELIELLCHLHGKKGTKSLNKEDSKQLKFLYQYSDIIFEDNPENKAKFAALMLICVYLMGDKEETQRRLKEVQQLRDSLTSNPSPKDEGISSTLSTDSKHYTLNSQLEEPLPAIEGGDGGGSLDCYLTIAQFIVTHKPELRKAAKSWRKSHPECSLSIRRLLSIAKQIRC